MNHRNTVFLVLTGWELVRFYIVSAFILLPDSGSGALTVVFALAPELLAVAAFFFLWYDFDRYRAYRPLMVAMKALSLVTALVFVVASFYAAGAASGEGAGPLITRFRGGLLVGAGDAVALAALVFLVRHGEKADTAVPASVETSGETVGAAQSSPAPEGQQTAKGTEAEEVPDRLDEGGR